MTFAGRAAAALLAAACGALPLPSVAEPGQAPRAHGLIVRLKPVAADDGASLHTPADAPRWRRVLGEAGLSGRSGRREPRLRPVGRDQQLLQFEQPLSRDEATALRERLQAQADVEWVEPSVRERRLQAASGDPLFVQQWWLQPPAGSNANVIEARRRGVAGFQNAWLRANQVPVVVAVLDTGMTEHPDLSGRVLPGYDFVSELVYANDGNGWDDDPADPGDWVSQQDLDRDPQAFAECAVEDSSWHGTIIAGIIAARPDNGIGGKGTHPGAAVLPVRVAGKCGAAVEDIIDGMRWAAGLRVAGAPLNPHPARIVNISFGGSAACGRAYQSAVDELRAVGAVVVAAAGNTWGSPARPANCRDVIGVVGLNRDGFKTNYSSFGATLSASGIATVSGDDADGAWGERLADSGLLTPTNRGRTTASGAGYASMYGTSFAAPQVAGTVALMLGLSPALSHAQIVQGLRVSARPHVRSPRIADCSDANPGRCICTTSTCGVGILDAEQALIYAAMPDSYVPPQRPPAVIDNADVDAALALAAQDRLPGGAVVAAGDGDSGGGAFGGVGLFVLAAASLALGRCGRRAAAAPVRTKSADRDAA